MNPQGPLFDLAVWKPALEKFGEVTHLTTFLYDTEEKIVCGPLPSSPLFAAFEKAGYDPGIFAACARQCLAQASSRPAVVVPPSYGLGVVGTSLVLEGTIVGAAVAGYALVDFSQSSAIERLARQAGMPFRDLWEIARRQQPIPERRLVVHGELLQVLGDAVLRENYRTRQYEETAARLQKEMGAKDEFLAVVTHELRTPLTPILGWANLLETSDSPERRRQAAAAIKRNARLEIKLVDDLLDMSRVINEKMALDISVEDLRATLRSALETMAESAEAKDIHVRFTDIKEALLLDADPGRLQQIFVNILSNAVKFTPPGGRIHVTVKRDQNDAVIQISDTGKGITRDFLPYVFEMFHQQELGTQRQYSGLGIGLALVRRLVELHRGCIEVASEGEGCGTQVTIRLPLATPAPKELAPRIYIERNDSRPFEHLTVLAVEDTEDTLEALRHMLEALGARVLTARDGLEALQVLATNRPEVVLCDLRMPRMDGFEFLRELSRIQGAHHPPVVALSGLSREADHRRSKAAGFEGHIDKPFDDAALVSVVGSVLMRHRTHSAD